MPETNFKTEIVEDMPFAHYLAVPAVSASMLKVIAGRSPLDMQRELTLERKQTPDMALGSTFHCLRLEPQNYDSLFVVRPEKYSLGDGFIESPKFDLRTTKGKAAQKAFNLAHSDKVVLREKEYQEAAKKAFEEENADKTIIAEDQYFHAANMSNAVHGSDLGRTLFADGRAEVSAFWIDKPTGIPCKARFDWLPDGHDVIVDLKKVHNDEPGEISRTCGKFGYHIQEAWYKRAARAVGLPHRNFLFCFCLDKPRYTVLWHYLDREEQQAGKIISQNALDTFAECKQNNSWPGYLAEEEPQPLTIPKYLL